MWFIGQAVISLLLTDYLDRQDPWTAVHAPCIHCRSGENRGTVFVRTLSFTCFSFAPLTAFFDFSSALDEPKRPKAVGAAWLRDCKSLATLVDESKYIVDLEEHKPSMTSK